MSQVTVGEILKCQFGKRVEQIKEAKVVAVKPGPMGDVLVEARDGTVMGTLKARTQPGGCHEADSMCFIGPTSYTREKAAKTLGFRNVS